jgi:large subunit ribosomal protein L24
LQDKYERNAYNKRYRERRKEKAEAKKDKEDDKKTYEVAGVYKRAMRQPARDAHKAMKEDWHLGPLAPRRDVGEKAGKLGTVDMGLHELHNLTKTQREQVKERMGDNVFRVHDRVVVLTGRDRGKIGQILSINEEKMSASVDGINKVSCRVTTHSNQTNSTNYTTRLPSTFRNTCPYTTPTHAASVSCAETCASTSSDSYVRSEIPRPKKSKRSSSIAWI